MRSTATRVLGLIVASHLTGCLSSAALELPWPQDSGSALLLLPGGQTFVLAPGDLGPPLLPTHRSVEVIFMRTSLDALQLEPGPVDLGGGRPLPEVIQRARGERTGRAFDWEPLAADPARVDMLSLAPLDPGACLLADQCVQDDMSRCGPCEAPIAAPVAPPVTECPWGPLAPRDCKPTVVTPSTCPRGMRAQWDNPDCVVIGECVLDADGFPSVERPDDLVFVRASGAAGDGTRARPYGSLAAALTAEGPRGTWVLGPDRFEETLALDPQSELTIIGACPERTEIAPLSGVAVELTGATLSLRGARLIGGESAAVVATASSSLALTEVEVEGPDGLHLADTVTTLERCAVRAVGTGLYQIGGALDVSHCDMRASSGLRFEDGDTLRFRASTTGPLAETELGDGVVARRSARVELRELRIGAHAVAAMRVGRVQDVLLDDIAVGPGTEKGIQFDDDVDPDFDLSAVLHAIYVEDVDRSGVGVRAGEFDISQVFVRTGQHAGLEVERVAEGGTTARIDQVFVEETGEAAILLGSERGVQIGTYATIEDVVCERRTPAAGGEQFCIEVSDEAIARIFRVFADAGHTAGLYIRQSSATAEDLRVAESTGPGVHLLSPALVELRRVEVQRALSAGLQIQGGNSPVEIQDFRVLEAEIGLEMDSDVRLRMRDFRAEDVAVGVLARHAPFVSMRGEISATQHGIRYVDEAELLPMLVGLRLEAPELFRRITP